MPDLIVEVLTDATPPEMVTLKGTTKLAITSMNVTSSVQLVEEDLLITGLGDEVIPVIEYTAAIRNLDPQLVQNATDSNIEFDLFANGELVESYDPANWDPTIDADTSGGASFGGVNGDDLTVGPNVGSVTIRATYNNALDPTHDGNGTTITAVTNVVAAVMNLLELYGPPENVVENTSYQLFARSRDGVTMAVINDPEPGVAYVVDSGPATITGPNNDILTVNASITPPVTITVSVSKAGFTGDTVIFNGIDPVTFPENEPPGMSVIENGIDGSTKAFAGWTSDATWDDNNRVVVVTDGAAKFGSSAVEKRFFSGDEAGFNGRIFRNIGNFTELYFRIVFLLSSNYQFGDGGALLEYGTTGGSRRFAIRLSRDHAGRIAWMDFTTNLGEYVPVDGSGNLIGAVTRGAYHTVEIHHIASITTGTGSLRCWFDNIEYTTFEKSFAGGTRLALTNQTWQATAPNTDKRLGKIIDTFQQIDFTKNVNDHVRISEIYFSGKS